VTKAGQDAVEQSSKELTGEGVDDIEDEPKKEP
jgi:hypothetical protein